jgi:hypothetical protein
MVTGGLKESIPHQDAIVTHFLRCSFIPSQVRRKLRFSISRAHKDDGMPLDIVSNPCPEKTKSIELLAFAVKRHTPEVHIQD